MRRPAIIEAVEEHLLAVGFRRGQWVWQPLQAELMLVVGQTIKSVKLKSGISQRALAYELGRIAGWAEFAGITPKPNGHDADAGSLILGALRPSTGTPAVMAG